MLSQMTSKGLEVSSGLWDIKSLWVAKHADNGVLALSMLEGSIPPHRPNVSITVVGAVE